MENIFRMLGYTAYYFLEFIGIALLARAVFSWFLDDNADSPIFTFTELITEPVVALVRGTIGRAFEKIASPVDISYFITVFIVEILAMAVHSIL